MADPITADVVVIGAGCAGLAAAVRLADHGRRVVVIEEAPRLGGRAASFRDRDTGDRVDNGQHVLFGCYRDTYAFLRAIGTDRLAPIDPSLALEFADMTGRRATLACPAWRPPAHLVAGVLRWPAVPFRDRLSALKLAGVIGRARRDGAAAVADDVDPSLTVAAWLRSHGQSTALCEWLWNPLAIAALNQSPAIAAARSFVRVIAEMFGPRIEDAAVGLPAVPLEDLYAEPAARYIEARGGVVLRGAPARVTLDAGGGIARVAAGAVDVAAPRVVSAVPWHALHRIWSAGVPASMSAIADNASKLGGEPIVTANLWFDRAVMTSRLCGLIGGAFHWAFDKSAIFGERAGHISIVASGATDLAPLDNAALAARAEHDLRRALAIAADARVIRAVIVRERRATFSLAPGGPPRPAATTPIRGLYLAGDWTDTGLPGTIESAVASGHRAAHAVMHDTDSGA